VEVEPEASTLTDEPTLTNADNDAALDAELQLLMAAERRTKPSRLERVHSRR
jgi:hypothetical protein